MVTVSLHALGFSSFAVQFGSFRTSIVVVSPRSTSGVAQNAPHTAAGRYELISAAPTLFAFWGSL